MPEHILPFPVKKALLLILFFTVWVDAYSFQQLSYQKDEPPAMEDLLTIKETFRYEVTYGFFRLGEVRVTLLSDTLYDGRLHHHLKTEMESNPSIPFMSKEIDHFHSLFFVNEDGLPVESIYWKNNLDEGKMEEIIYTFDRDNGKVYYKEEDDSRDTLDLVEPATSGHVIFYFSRLFAGSNQDFKLPVYVTKKAGFVLAENSTRKEVRNYAAFEEPIEAYMLRGSTQDIEGPFGFSGNFRAWFLTDDLRVPLEARVKVFLGNVKIKIVEYTRETL